MRPFTFAPSPLPDARPELAPPDVRRVRKSHGGVVAMSAAPDFDDFSQLEVRERRADSLSGNPVPLISH